MLTNTNNGSRRAKSRWSWTILLEFLHNFHRLGVFEYTGRPSKGVFWSCWLGSRVTQKVFGVICSICPSKSLDKITIDFYEDESQQSQFLWISKQRHKTERLVVELQPWCCWFDNHCLGGDRRPTHFALRWITPCFTVFCWRILICALSCWIGGFTDFVTMLNLCAIIVVTLQMYSHKRL